MSLTGGTKRRTKSGQTRIQGGKGKEARKTMRDVGHVEAIKPRITLYPNTSQYPPLLYMLQPLTICSPDKNKPACFLNEPDPGVKIDCTCSIGDVDISIRRL